MNPGMSRRAPSSARAAVMALFAAAVLMILFASAALPLAPPAAASAQPFAAGSPSPAPAPGGAGTTGLPAWQVVPVAGIPQTATQLLALTCVSSTDCWAVGNVWPGGATNSGEGPAATLAIHWNGTNWTRVPTPSPAYGNGPGDALDTIACPASTDCWAGGWQGAGPGTNGIGLLLHWNGTRWAAPPNPALLGISGPIGALACSSAAQCWAAGARGSPGGGYLYNAGGTRSLLRYSTLTGHAGWRLAGDTRQLPPTAGITSLACVPGAAVCWMVGAVPNPGAVPGPGLQQPSADTFAAEYVPGRGWAQTPTPSPPAPYSGPVDQLTSVACTSAASCWAAGDNPSNAASLETSSGETFLAYHWNGRGWSPAPVAAPPATSPAGFSAPSVSCSSAMSCWITGTSWSVTVGPGESYATAPPTYSAVAEHWDGSSWSQVRLPEPNSPDVRLSSVACVPGMCFAAGSYSGPFIPGSAAPAVHPLLLRAAAPRAQAGAPGAVSWWSGLERSRDLVAEVAGAGIIALAGAAGTGAVIRHRRRRTGRLRP